MEISIIKNDVIQKLRADRYFNEMEISRVVQSDINHKERIKIIAELTRENANINEALRLTEMYFPAASQPTAPQPEPAAG